MFVPAREYAERVKVFQVYATKQRVELQGVPFRPLEIFERTIQRIVPEHHASTQILIVTQAVVKADDPKTGFHCPVL